MSISMLSLVILLQVGDAAWNPFNWSTTTYLIAIALVLVLHRFVPRDRAWYVRLGREMLLIAPAVFLYFAVRGMVDANDREPEAIRNAESIIGLQEKLGVFHEPALQKWILESGALVDVVNWIYIWGHWPVVVGTLVWLIVWRPESHTFYRNAFLLSGIAAMFVFALFPVAPPRLMPDLAVVDTVTQQSQSYRVLQPPALTNPFAAMPSLHFGWNLLMGIAIVRESRHRLARAFGYAIPIGMFLAIILTANHYFLDGLAGGALVLGTLGLLALWNARQRRPVEVPTRPVVVEREPARAVAGVGAPYFSVVTERRNGTQSSRTRVYGPALRADAGSRTDDRAVACLSEGIGRGSAVSVEDD